MKKAARETDLTKILPDPFPEACMEPLEWTQILATLDTCVNEATPIHFCDDEGYDLIPLNMINASLITKKKQTETQEVQCLRIQDEISIRDLDSETE